MTAMVTTLSMVVFGLAPIGVGVGLGSLMLRGILTSLQTAISKAQVPATVVEATPATIIPFGRDRRERVEHTSDDVRLAA